MLNQIPIFGWMLSILFSISISIPFYIIWTKSGIGQQYFYSLPNTYHSIPFWHCVGLFIVIDILKYMLTPKLISCTNEINGKDDV